MVRALLELEDDDGVERAGRPFTDMKAKGSIRADQVGQAGIEPATKGL
jgi:hypothetical protein